MNFEQVINPNIIDLNMLVNNKEEAIHHLAQLLYDAGYVHDLDQYLKDVYLREAEGMTGMGSHIAIPHGKSTGVKQAGIAIGRSKAMIEWESYDEQPVNFFFLFAVPKDEASDHHLRLLAHLAGKLGDAQLLEKLAITNTAAELIRLFN